MYQKLPSSYLVQGTFKNKKKVRKIHFKKKIIKKLPFSY
jgi:hypothetical protein